MILNSIKRIIISRTDSIGDVILTLPIAGILKLKIPNCEIYFLGRTYTRDIINCCQNVDKFIDYSEIEKLPYEKQIELLKSVQADAIIHVFPDKEIVKLSNKAGIRFRIGTSHRLYNILYCNKLVSFSRKKSILHESQLNIKLLEPFGMNLEMYSTESLFSKICFKPDELSEKHKIFYLKNNKVNIILHPKSKGSAREWSLANYKKLISLLPTDKYHIILTGTEDEGKLFRNELISSHSDNITDTSGKLSLNELISLISKVDALVACSTGPLHIAGVCNINSIGLFPPIKPMHPARWHPIGEKVKIFCTEKKCSKCRDTLQCDCLNDISPEKVASYIIENIK